LSDRVGSVVYITDIVTNARGTETLQGSGVLISPDEVLTAAHVVWSANVGAEGGVLATDITVIPGYEANDVSPGQNAPYGSVSGTVTHYNAVDDAGGFLTNEESQNDYAVIHLSADVAAAGTMALGVDSAGGAATVTGYPASAGGTQVSHAETVEPYSQTSFASTYGDLSLFVGPPLGDGSSGGPVWIEGANGPSVIGLVSSASDNLTGFFTEITSAAETTIESWVAQDDLACFLQGTRVATRRGEVPVEALTTDDILPVRRAGFARVIWLGRRHVDCRRHPRPADVWPVRIRPYAFGQGQPSRDLWLSPDHAVFVGGRLVPVRHLVNGATIIQEPRDSAVYWHVELPRHDLLWAEGLAVESYLDTGNRGAFQAAARPPSPWSGRRRAARATPLPQKKATA
jgi:V8-like Glu-specific endopeptidase